MSEGLFRQLFSSCGSSYLGLSICGSRKYCGMEKEKIPYQFLLHFSYDKAATLCGTSSVHRAWQPPFPTVNLAHTPPAECKWLLSPWWDGELGTWIFTEPWKFESLLFLSFPQDISLFTIYPWEQGNFSSTPNYLYSSRGSQGRGERKVKEEEM